MHICICKAHPQMLKRSLLPCPRQKATPEVAAPVAPTVMVRASSSAAQPGKCWWIGESSLHPALLTCVWLSCAPREASRHSGGVKLPALGRLK